MYTYIFFFNEIYEHTICFIIIKYNSLRIISLYNGWAIKLNVQYSKLIALLYYILKHLQYL